MRKNWSRNERILALDLYFSIHAASSRPISLDPDHPRIVELSKMLERTRNSIKMKLDNFLALDPDYPGVGLHNVASGDREIWDEFAERREDLTAAAQAIRARISD